MSDHEANGKAWIVAPGAYLQQKNAQRLYEKPSSPTSQYLTMPDGCKLAIDVYLPQPVTQAPSGQFPCILIFTPYYRRWQLKNPQQGENSPNAAIYRDAFVPHGYALVVIDVRGTGASYGVRDSFRSPKERDDTREIADWVVAQPWSNGILGATGISYLGAASDFLASTGHPAVKAIAPISGVWDTYADHYYPGGVYQNRLAYLYGEMSVALDTGDPEKLRQYAYYQDPNLVGPAPVDDDPQGVGVKEALAEHASSFYMPDFIDKFEFREMPYAYDDAFHSGVIGPYWYRPSIPDNVAVLSICGWMDGCGYTNGSIARFLTLGKSNPDSHLLIGPWDHGARINHSPWRAAEVPEFNLYAEILRFFDHFLKGEDNDYGSEQKVHYFALRDERWHGSPAWPPQGSAPIRFDIGAMQAEASSDALTMPRTFATGSGHHTRYERIAAIDCREYYPDWGRQIAAMRSFRTEPLSAEQIIAGHVELDLWVEADKKDFVVFAYLSEEQADGTVRYITEGMLRAGHRKTSPCTENYVASWTYRSFSRQDYEPVEPHTPVNLRIPLHPIAWKLEASSRLVLSLAQTDSDHFAQIPPGQPATITILDKSEYPSHILVPVLHEKRN